MCARRSGRGRLGATLRLGRLCGGARKREIAQQGVTILLIAHNMGFLSTVADDVVVMAEGKVLTRGPLEVVRTHQEVIAAYLGASNALPELGEQVRSV